MLTTVHAQPGLDEILEFDSLGRLSGNSNRTTRHFALKTLVRWGGVPRSFFLKIPCVQIGEIFELQSGE